MMLLRYRWHPIDEPGTERWTAWIRCETLYLVGGKVPVYPHQKITAIELKDTIRETS